MVNISLSKYFMSSFSGTLNFFDTSFIVFSKVFRKSEGLASIVLKIESTAFLIFWRQFFVFSRFFVFILFKNHVLIKFFNPSHCVPLDLQKSSTTLDVLPLKEHQPYQSLNFQNVLQSKFSPDAILSIISLDIYFSSSSTC